ncbi:MAG: phenylalanine--tRNA ligase subunit beta [Candidatus Bathyarchaeota archaeon]|nr:phenylalanine--tRNA ligase subunit beta [Candidatus Bathyarchaeota archaeon]
MPTIDMDCNELQRLLKLNLNGDMEKLDDILAYVKAEVKGVNEKEGTVNIEMKDTNRPDLWSVDGLARGLQCYLGIQKGIKTYQLGDSAVEVTVDDNLEGIRPFIACAVIKDINLSDSMIKGIMHLQDKLDGTFGRNRQKTSIGIYNLDLIKPPIRYCAVKPSDVSFVPLGFEEKMGLDQILEFHPKGNEYGHIVKKNQLYPMLYDSEGKVLSFPPIINSNDLGKITEDSRNLLVEVTGTLHKTVLNTLNLVTSALIDRGGKAYKATIHYTQTNQTVVTPDFSNRTMNLSVNETCKLLGLELSAEKIAELLQTAGLGVAKVSADVVDVLVPFYRVDVMHPVDLMEDVAVAYGYNNIEPLWRELPTTGRAKPEQHIINLARDLMVGLGYQETLNNTLTNPQNLFEKMNTQPTPIVEVTNPQVVTMTCLRNQLLPSLMEFLSVNPSVEFPQKIFEPGKVTLIDNSKETKTDDQNWLAAATTHATAGFSEAKSALDSFLSNLGVQWQIRETAHPSFVEGRVGMVIVDGAEVGVVGEVSPAVLEAWKLENPVAAFEINFQKIAPP